MKKSLSFLFLVDMIIVVAALCLAIEEPRTAWGLDECADGLLEFAAPQ